MGYEGQNRILDSRTIYKELFVHLLKSKYHSMIYFLYVNLTNIHEPDNNKT